MKLSTQVGTRTFCITSVIGLAMGMLLAGCGDDSGSSADVGMTTADKDAGTDGVASGGASKSSDTDGGVGGEGEQTTTGNTADSTSDGAGGGTTDNLNDTSSTTAQTSTSDSGGSKPVIQIMTDVPPETKLSDLTDDEIKQMCEALQMELDSGVLTQYTCALSAVLTSALSAQTDQEFADMCAAAEADCIAMSTSQDSSIDCTNPDPFPAGCEATVSDYETCLNQAFAQFPQLSCDDSRTDALAALAGAGAIGDTGGGLPDTAECNSVNGCTDLAGGVTMMMP